MVFFIVLFLTPRLAYGFGLTKKAEPPPTCDVNRDSGTASANGGWLRRLVRRQHRQLLAKWFAAFINGRSAAINVGNVTKTKMLIVVAKKTTHDGNLSALRNQIQRQ